MQTQGTVHSSYGIENHGIQNVNMVYWNLQGNRFKIRQD